jgi:hypothetical protein
MENRAFVNLKILALIFSGLILIQGVWAGLFYVERMAFLDAAFVLTQIIHEGKPVIMVGRYGSVLTQFWPWIGVKAGLSLNALMLLYSLSFPILFMTVAWILYMLRQYVYVIVLGLYFVMFYTDSFFWTNNEIHQAVALFCLGTGLYEYHVSLKRSPRVLFFWMSMFIVGLAILTHPLMIIVSLYFILYHFVARREGLKKNSYLSLYIFVLFSVLVKYMLSQANWYDGQKLQVLSHLRMNDVISHMSGGEFFRFFAEWPHYYPISMAFVIIWIIVAVHQRLWLLLISSILFFTGHVWLVSLVVDQFNRFYIESQWMLLSLFVGWPYMYHLDKTPSILKHITGFISVVAVLYWSYTLWDVSETYTERKEWIENKISWMTERDMGKMIIDTLHPDEKKLLKMTWGLPSESLLLSSRLGSSVTFIFRENMVDTVNISDFHDCFKVIPAEEMNKTYFDLKPDEKYISEKEKLFSQEAEPVPK